MLICGGAFCGGQLPQVETKPILVTGAHRSGTTWVGRMLAEAPNVLYIREPFNVAKPPGPGVCNLRSELWFPYIAPGERTSFQRPLSRTVTLRYDLPAALRCSSSLGEARKALAECLRFRRHRQGGARALIKDPLAVFAAEWLASVFAMNVIVMIRHPVAFVGSVRARNWSHPFSHFLHQPRLVDDLLSPFRAEIEWFAGAERPVIDQAVLLWRLIYHTVLGYRRRHPEWIFLRHEDISRDPVRGFAELFARLHLPFRPQVKATIETYSGARNPAQLDGGASHYSLVRHSRANLASWRSRLTPAEVGRIRRAVAPIACQLYPEEPW
jgi:Sulfotransferase family